MEDNNPQSNMQSFDNRKIVKRKKLLIIIVFLIILIDSIGIWAFIINRDDPSIDRYALETHSGFQKKELIPYTQFKITNQDELNIFCELYSGFSFNSDYDLSNKTIFIETEYCGSSSTEVTLDKVVINNKVKFIYSKHNSSSLYGNMVVAYWYLVAIIPNEKLEGVNTNNWISPIEAKNNIRYEFSCYIESTDLNNLIAIREKINEIGNIKINSYNYYNEKYLIYRSNDLTKPEKFYAQSKTHIYKLKSYDESSVNQLVEYINNNEVGINVIVVIKDELSITEYEKRKESFNTQNDLSEPQYKVKLKYDYIGNRLNHIIETKLKGIFTDASVDIDTISSSTILITYSNLTPSQLSEKIEFISNNYKTWDAINFQVEGSFD